MSADIIPLAAGALALAAAAAVPNAAHAAGDRHPGVYPFAPLREGRRASHKPLADRQIGPTVVRVG